MISYSGKGVCCSYTHLDAGGLRQEVVTVRDLEHIVARRDRHAELAHRLELGEKRFLPQERDHGRLSLGHRDSRSINSMNT